MTSFRKLYRNDDISLVARGIYLNDKKIFDALFRDEEEAIKVIKSLIESEYVNEYHGFFTTVIYDESPDQIEGFVITYKKDQIPSNSALRAYDNENKIPAPLLLLNTLLSNFRHELAGDDYVIKNLYVLEEYRNKGHATRLVKKSIQKARQNNAKKIVLEVEEGNEDLLDFFMRLGFKLNNEKLTPILGKLRGYKRLKYELL